MFNKKEALHLLATILILSIVFSWNDKNPSFNITIWFTNFLTVLIMVSVAVLIHEVAHKVVAKRKDATSEYHILNITRIWFQEKLKKPLPVWSFLALFITFASRGQLYFTAVGGNTIEPIQHKRTGRKHMFLTGYEEALILLSGPLANIGLIVLANLAGKAFGFNLEQFITINIVLALWHLVPLPGFDGNGIYFGSRFLYLFGLAFIVGAFLLQWLSLVWSVPLSLLLASLATLLYYWKDQG